MASKWNLTFILQTYAFPILFHLGVGLYHHPVAQALSPHPISNQKPVLSILPPNISQIHVCFFICSATLVQAIISPGLLQIVLSMVSLLQFLLSPPKIFLHIAARLISEKHELNHVTPLHKILQ